MPNLFDPWTTNKMTLRNRFVRSATMDGIANQGSVSEAEIKLYEDLAGGEIGLIVSHGLAPTREGQTGAGQISVATDEAVPGLKQLTDIIHAGGGKIVAQILHAGWRAREEFTGTLPVGPSDTVNPRTGARIRGLSSDEIYQMVEDFVQAARRIKEAGFDGVQLHGAHSWLLSAFFSPATNKRNDEWGGSLEKNANLARAIIRGIRKMAGPEYPVMIKLGIQDYHPEGKSTAGGVLQAKLLEAAGVDCIEVSEGLEADQSHHIRLDAVRPYYLEECTEARKALSLPLILVGGMRDVRDMQAVLDEGIADAVSMCRPFIMDPLLVKHLREALAETSKCISCNKCLGQTRLGSLRCVLV
jgi:2,4-dienoyl-CoA reductase-like NADH-dependent reductase (Old Yellow Enzyme family)